LAGCDKQQTPVTGKNPNIKNMVVCLCLSEGDFFILEKQRLNVKLLENPALPSADQKCQFYTLRCSEQCNLTLNVLD